MYFLAAVSLLSAVIAQAAPTTTVAPSSATTTTASTATASDVNSACAVQPTGVSVRPSTDTAAAFTKYTGFHGAAVSAASPSGYLISFASANKAVAQSDSYMTYYLLNSYDPQTCANYCDNSYGCTSFNIFFERAPTLNPAAGCPNPPSATYVKCSLFAHTIASTQLATNAGQWRGPYVGNNVTQNFQVVLAGSNAYNKN